MELKYLSHKFVSLQKISSNRTFMELKYPSDPDARFVTKF